MAAPKLIRNMAVMAKLETTPGVDPTPTTAANGMLVGSVTLTPVEQEAIDRDIVMSTLGQPDRIIVANWQTMEFNVELASSGTAGTPPAWAPLLQASGWTLTDTTVDDTFALRSSGFQTATIYGVVDGLLHKLSYGAGDVSINLDARKIPHMKFKFTGIWSPVTDIAHPLPDYSAFRKALAVNKQNTTATLFGVSASIESLQINLANSVSYLNRINTERVGITDRKPAGSISMEMTDVATYDWVSAIANGTTGALHLAHGATAGQIVQLDAPKVQLSRPKYGNDNGVLMLQADLTFSPVSGNDELVLVTK